MTNLTKKQKYTLGIVGAILVYVATAFIIPFPSEFLSYGIAKFVYGGVTVENITKSFTFLWIGGIVILGIGLSLFKLSGKQLSLKNMRK